MTEHGLAQVDVPRIFHHSYNGPVRCFVDTNAFADWIAVSKKVAGHPLVNNDDLRSAKRVVSSEITPADQRYVERLEVVGRDIGGVDAHLFVFAGSVAFDHYAGPVPTSGERRV